MWFLHTQPRVDGDQWFSENLLENPIRYINKKIYLIIKNYMCVYIIYIYNLFNMSIIGHILYILYWRLTFNVPRILSESCLCISIDILYINLSRARKEHRTIDEK